MVVPVVHSVVLSSVVHSVVHTVCNPMVLSSVVLHPVVLSSEVGATVVVPVAPSAAAQRYKCEGPNFANVPHLLESLTGLIQPFSVHCLPTAVYPLPSGGGRKKTGVIPHEYNQHGFG